LLYEITVTIEYTRSSSDYSESEQLNQYGMYWPMYKLRFSITLNRKFCYWTGIWNLFNCAFNFS